MTDILRINKLISYKVIRKTRAKFVANNFDVDSTHRNHMFVMETGLNFDTPRPIRDYISFLKMDIPDQMIYVLALQSTETRLVKANKNKEKENTPSPDTVEVAQQQFVSNSSDV